MSIKKYVTVGFFAVTAAASFEAVANTNDDANNSKTNKRVEQNAEVNAQDQGNSKQDLELTQNIRRSVVDQESFSMDAKNIKIISINGVVTLKGPVRSAEEKQKIVDLATKIAGRSNVKNNIEIIK